MRSLPPLSLLLLTACIESDHPTSPVPDRPMEEVPAQQALADGDREYRFANGCVIVLEPSRAVVRSESPPCALYQRDIALLYASAD